MIHFRDNWNVHIYFCINLCVINYDFELHIDLKLSAEEK